jgi:phenylpropionate dioxygenase-like ring-hydroxylating dioxygenase large terminal subunit
MLDIDQPPTVAAALASGATLPAHWYTSPVHYHEEQQTIFRKSWLFVGLIEDVAQPGDFFTIQIGDVPLVIVRDGATLRAFVNVCRHRGSVVATAPCGNRATLQCPYHAWTYRLDGTLHRAPGMGDEANFDPSAFSLVPTRLETWGPFIFVNLDSHAAPLAATLGELPDLVAGTGLDFSKIRRRVRRTQVIDANWKAVIDNYLECYHCPVAHPGFCDLIDVTDYHITEYEYFSTQTGSLKASKPGKDEHPYDASQGVTDGFYAYLWPTFTLNIYPGPGNVSLNLFIPQDADHTLAIYDYCFADAVSEAASAEFIRFIDQVQDEDAVLCANVQRGLRSGFFAGGRLMQSRERALYHFQNLVACSMEE